MKPFILSSAFALAVVALGSQAFAGMPVGPRETRLLSLAASLDPLGDSQPRAHVPQGYVAPFGIQVHPSCFRYAAQAGISRESAETGFDHVVYNAVEGVGERCLSRYPELRPYLREWFAQFRRTVITCTTKTQNELHFGAMNIAAGINVAQDLSPDERNGIDVAGLLGQASLARSYRTVVMFPRDTFTSSVTQYDRPFAADGVIHEVLHSTHANNREDHNTVEYRAPDGGSCGDNILVDRINVVATLCSRDQLSGGKFDTSSYWFQRISHCGPAQCENLFSGETPRTDVAELIESYYTPSTGLSRQDAQSLCSKIYDEGACRYNLATQGETITRSAIPQLREVGDRLRERFGELFPHSPVQINQHVLALYPDLQARMREASNTACFRSVFNTVVGDHYYLRDTEMLSMLEPTPRRNALATLSLALDKIDHSPQCSPGERGQLENIINGLEGRLNWAFNTTAYLNLIQPRFLHQAEIDYEPSMFDTATGDLRGLVGGPLFDEYLATVRRFHYKSPDFDCAAANLTPLQGIAGFQRLTSMRPSTAHCAAN